MKFRSLVFVILALLLGDLFADKEGLFFIYDWGPEIPISAYPKENVTLYPNSTYTHAFGENNGIGAALDPDNGLFQTWQSSLFRSLFNRMLLHPKRTR